MLIVYAHSSIQKRHQKENGSVVPRQTSKHSCCVMNDIKGNVGFQEQCSTTSLLCSEFPDVEHYFHDCPIFH